MPSIFHYTDATGLIGILENETLFATDYRYLNDSSEGQVIKELLLPIFEAEIASITPKLIGKKWLKKEFYQDHGIGGHKLQAESIYKALTRATDNVSPFFVSSFCRHDENSAAYEHGLLSQWRAYSQGSGFALEFDEAKIADLIKIEQNKYCYAGLKWDYVTYEAYSEAFDRQQFDGVASEMVRSQFETVNIDVSEVTGKKDLDKAVLEYAKLAPFFKHAGFKEESEYRIVGVCVRRSKVPKGEPREAKQIKFRQRNNFIVPYIELFDHGPQFPLKSIIVGPSHSQQRQAEAVKMLAETEGFSIDIRLSDIPLRT